MGHLRRTIETYRDLLLGVAVVAVASVAMLWTSSGGVLAQAGNSGNVTVPPEKQPGNKTIGMLVPRVDCVMPDVENAGYYIAAFGYERVRVGNRSPDIVTIPYGVPYNYVESNDSAFISNDAVGAPEQFSLGLKQFQFSIRFGAGDWLRWNLYDPEAGVSRFVVADQNTASACAVPGPPGPQGKTGDTGPEGKAGRDGNVGPQGPEGKAGRDGNVGPPGPEGKAGRDGNVGPQGPEGKAGRDGNVGPQGPEGKAGRDGNVGPQGPKGLDGARGADGNVGPRGPMGLTGLGLSFLSQIVTASGALTLGPDNASMIYLVQTPSNGSSQITLTLPPAGNATSRFVTIRRLDSRGKVFVTARPGESLEGRGRERPQDAIPLADRAEYVTLVSDGTAWYVFADGK